LLIQNSCVSFKPGYETIAENKKYDDTKGLLKNALLIESNANSKEEVLKLIDAFKEIEKVDPLNYYAL